MTDRAKRISWKMFGFSVGDFGPVVDEMQKRATPRRAESPRSLGVAGPVSGCCQADLTGPYFVRASLHLNGSDTDFLVVLNQNRDFSL